MRRVSTPALLYCCVSRWPCWPPLGLRRQLRQPTPGTGGSNATAGTTGARGRAEARARPAPPAPPGSAGTTRLRRNDGRRGHDLDGRHDRQPPATAAAGSGADGAAAAARPGTRGAAARRARAGASGTAGTTGSGRLGQLHVHADVGDQHEDRDRRHRHLVDHARGRDVGEDRLRPHDLVRHDARRSTSVTPSYRTLLLGMKTSQMYHYRITATSGSRLVPERRLHDHDGRARDRVCMKPTVTTDDRDRPLRRLPGHRPVRAERRAGSTAYILDADGDYVWWYTSATT